MPENGRWDLIRRLKGLCEELTLEICPSIQIHPVYTEYTLNMMRCKKISIWATDVKL